MADNKTTGLLLLGGATIFLLPKLVGASETKSSQSGGSSGGGGSFVVVPTDSTSNLKTSDTGLADVGTGEIKDTQTKKQMEELKEQYDIYQKELLSTPVSSETYTNTSFSNQTKKGEATAGYKTTTQTTVTKTLGGDEIVTQTKKEEKIAGTEWKVAPVEKTNIFQKVVNFFKGGYQEIKSTGNLGSVGDFLRRI
jgi:hypothetical protein